MGVVYVSAKLTVLPSEARELVLNDLREAGLEPRVEGQRVVVEWARDESRSRAEVRFEAAGPGSVVRLELTHGPELFNEWFVSQAILPLLRAVAAH